MALLWTPGSPDLFFTGYPGLLLRFISRKWVLPEIFFAERNKLFYDCQVFVMDGNADVDISRDRKYQPADTYFRIRDPEGHGRC